MLHLYYVILLLYDNFLSLIFFTVRVHIHSFFVLFVALFAAQSCASKETRRCPPLQRFLLSLLSHNPHSLQATSLISCTLHLTSPFFPYVSSISCFLSVCVSYLQFLFPLRRFRIFVRLIVST